MTKSPNSTDVTGTRNRSNDLNYLSGLCAKCIEGCPGLCEVGKSSFRGQEALYPEPFGKTTSAAEKKFPVDYSDFNIMGTAFHAYGIEENSDKAIFPNVNLETRLGHDKGIKLKFPAGIPGLGSTDVAKNNWQGLAIGAAISGIYLTIGENVVGMDMEAIIKDRKVVESPELRKRVELYKKWQQDDYGMIIVQSNVEDTRLGVLEYALKDLGVKAVELKWGQGAKDIGGEVKIKDLEKAQLLYERGYIVLPNPTDSEVIKAFKNKEFEEFERHSRIGMGSKEEFLDRVKELRNLGAKYVFLKTGAYRPIDLARAVAWTSEAGIDVLTVDAAGGGTGMSPWRMMNEWGIPPIEIAGLTYQYAEKLAKNNKKLPDIILAGGFALEDHIFKGLAIGAPYVKAIAMARAPITAAMVGKTLEEKIKEKQIPPNATKYGNTKEQIFVGSFDLKKQFKEKYDEIPASAIAVYTYFKRISQGLKQLMTGARKFDVSLISRNDIAALTKDASRISNIPLVTDIDNGEAEKILS